MMVKKAIIPAAGLGTRFLPASKAMPKEMLPIIDKPTIQLIVEEAVDSGIEDILIITSRGKGIMEDHFDKSPELERALEIRHEKKALDIIKEVSTSANIHYIRQREPKGLGDAVLYGKSFIGNEPFAVLVGDDVVDSKTPCTRQLIDMFEKYNATILGCQVVDRQNISKYASVDGVYVKENLYRVKGLIEKPSAKEATSNQAVLGKYIITPTIFEILERINPGVGGEIQLTDALGELARVEEVYAYNFKGRRYDIGSKQGYLEAIVEYALKREDLRDDFKRYLSKIIDSDLYKGN
ncbi:MAG: UTP--glucose-1-phosphate uridylyltransferase GalU [Clostridiales bacterium]|nr:UTP--glucose-1-phosphate uridylyltransferase GalU [Clostridiales bacterium]